LGAVELGGVYESLYWERLRSGLLSGSSEQRKYCLGILRESLRLPRKDVNTTFMSLVVSELGDYRQQYEKYCSLFETIVLDRYPNQIQACLPELSRLLGGGSLILPVWITTLLSAVLNPKIQEGVRKMVGNWYIDFVVGNSRDVLQTEAEERTFFDKNAQFLVEGFLPWASQGTLFTSALVVTREAVVCSHGETLAKVVSRFIAGSSEPVQRELLHGILQFILDRGGRIFQYSIMYLLKGLLDGFRCNPPSVDLNAEDFSLFPRVSRLPGLPEMAADLCTAYCADFCKAFYFSTGNVAAKKHSDIPGYDLLSTRIQDLRTQPVSNHPITGQVIQSRNVKRVPSLRHFLEELNSVQHKNIQDDLFPLACDEVIQFLDIHNPGSLSYPELCEVLEALWEEADRQEYRRPVVVKLPPLFFHPNCISVCVTRYAENKDSGSDEPLVALLTRVMERLYKLAEGRPYLLSTLWDSIRKACFAQPQVISILPLESLLVQFIERPPISKKEFMFEVAAGDKLQQYFDQRTYASYYGKREWHGYAALIDLLNRFPTEQLDVAKRVLNKVLEPWRSQKKPVPIISKWKHAFQLQVMLLLSESCIFEWDAAWYLDSYMQALLLEPWPRYRFLLEWIISRIYYRYPQFSDRILSDLGNLDDSVPIHIASLMKLAVLAAPFLDSEDFALQLMTQLIPFASSPKVHIRHEAHWSFPILWELAEYNEWTSIQSNPAFRALNDFIRGLEKFKKPASTIRTLRLDAVDDFRIVEIFQGDYLSLETPERELVTYDDFITLWRGDRRDLFDRFHIRVGLGMQKPARASSTCEESLAETEAGAKPDMIEAPLQTKAGFDLASLLPPSGPPSANTRRPASVVLVASLIDNPTNLGGLSRISESFGLETLCINSLTHLSSKDFQATAVTSHKHLPINELKLENVPSYLVDMKRKGYEVVGIEQTDQSGMLGQGKKNKKGGVGTLPEKCVLVLGSERGGISSEVLAVVDRCVEIRTVGVTRSLNVQTAGGIAVYEWWREWGGDA
jgi:tRNA guanosine-2'-O-methyltransferase